MVSNVGNWIDKLLICKVYQTVPPVIILLRNFNNTDPEYLYAHASKHFLPHCSVSRKLIKCIRQIFDATMEHILVIDVHT